MAVAAALSFVGVLAAGALDRRRPLPQLALEGPATVAATMPPKPTWNREVMR
jgi:hypothetical protein